MLNDFHAKSNNSAWNWANLMGIFLWKLQYVHLTNKLKKSDNDLKLFFGEFSMWRNEKIGVEG